MASLPSTESLLGTGAEIACDESGSSQPPFPPPLPLPSSPPRPDASSASGGVELVAGSVLYTTLPQSDVARALDYSGMVGLMKSYLIAMNLDDAADLYMSAFREYVQADHAGEPYSDAYEVGFRGSGFRVRVSGFGVLGSGFGSLHP